MNKNIGIIVGIIILVVITGGIYASIKSKNDATIKEDGAKLKMMEDQKMTEDDKVTMEKDEADMIDKSDAMMKAGSYEVYSTEKVKRASTTHDVVLFFRASWCPTCKAVDADIKNNLAKIPPNLTILDVDYDKSSLLKQQYKVTYQHTFVQVDQEGNLIKKWSGSPTLAALVSQVQ